jgi:hypothetical protein
LCVSKLVRCLSWTFQHTCVSQLICNQDRCLWCAGEIFSCNAEVSDARHYIASFRWWQTTWWNTSDALLLPPPALSVTLIRFLLFAGDSLPVVMLRDFIRLICNNRAGCGVGVTRYSCIEEIPNHH